MIESKRNLLSCSKQLAYKALPRLTILTIVFVVGSSSATGAIIVDSLVEENTDWVANQWSAFSTTFLNPSVQEGTRQAVTSSVSGSTNKVTLPSSSADFSGLKLAAGVYTLQFSIGDYSNLTFAPTRLVNFGPLTWNSINPGDASSATTPTPANGFWELWTLEFDIPIGDPRIGQDLDFQFVQNTGGGSSFIAFDGVGGQSPDGTGFLVSFAPIVPEPSSLALATLGLLSLGLVGWRRRRR